MVFKKMSYKCKVILTERSPLPRLASEATHKPSIKVTNSPFDTVSSCDDKLV